MSRQDKRCIPWPLPGNSDQSTQKAGFKIPCPTSMIHSNCLARRYMQRESTLRPHLVALPGRVLTADLALNTSFKANIAIIECLIPPFRLSILSKTTFFT